LSEVVSDNINALSQIIKQNKFAEKNHSKEDGEEEIFLLDQVHYTETNFFKLSIQS
jgi:hypothetical protein